MLQTLDCKLSDLAQFDGSTQDPRPWLGLFHSKIKPTIDPEKTILPTRST